MEKPHIFFSLDSLRGLAAFAVVSFHSKSLLGAQLFEHGYLAVDFFLMLSGFVLTFAYQARLDNGWSTTSFMKTRVARLYPLYFLGLALGFLYRIFLFPTGAVHLTPGYLIISSLLAIFMLPIFGFARQSQHYAFPYNLPAWSLFLEVLANVLHALLMRRRSLLVSMITLAVSGSALMYAAKSHGSLDFGAFAVGFPFAILRMIFSYVAGNCIFQLWRSKKFPFSIHPVLGGGLLLLALCLHTAKRYHAFYDLVIALLIFPILLILSANSPPPMKSRLTRIFQLLGAASFAVYAIHYSWVLASEELCKSISLRYQMSSSIYLAPWSGIVLITSVFVFAIFLDKFYDLPARAFLRRRFFGKPETP